jgi:hypothetical protein
MSPLFYHFTNHLRLSLLGLLAFLFALLKRTMTLLAKIPVSVGALGFITGLGASPIDKTLGRLVYSPLEYFPLLAGHIFADDSVAEAIPGFALYNITEGASATNLSPWFTRWLLCQKLTYCSTELDIRATEHRSAPSLVEHFTVLSAFAINAVLIIWPILMGDWYGLAASLSLVSLVLVRVWILWACRQALDRNNVRWASTLSQRKEVKLFITLPSGDSIVVKTTTGITQNCLLTGARPSSKNWHRIVRGICWLAFSAHVVSLGMASLAVQVPLVALTLLFSVLVVLQIGCDESRVGNRLAISRRDNEGLGSRAQTYMLLDLTEDEEQCFLEWPLFPKRVNRLWWSVFERFVADTKVDRRELYTWSERMQVAHADHREAAEHIETQEDKALGTKFKL